jgi:hypothetical protein
MIPFMPRDCGAGDRERVKVRRLSVPVRPWLALRPSELEAAGGGLGGRRGFLFVSPPLLRVSETLMELRLPMTVCESPSVSSSSVLNPDAELTNASARCQQYALFCVIATVRSKSARIQTHETAFH